MYKALVEIGGYNKGDEVPEALALRWLEQYKVPQVAKVDEESEVEEGSEDELASPEEEHAAEESEVDPLLDNYLAQNANAVIKALAEDDLPEEKLAQLVAMEKADKNRSSVLKALAEKLE